MNREKMMELLGVKYPKMFLSTTEEFDGSNGGIWTSGEGEILAKDNFPLFNYFNEVFKEIRYVLGVHREMVDLLDEHGWFAEFHDAGTVILWQA